MTQKLLVWLFIEPWHGSALGLGVVYLPLHFLKTEWWVQAQFYPQPENEKMRTRSQIPGFLQSTIKFEIYHGNYDDVFKGWNWKKQKKTSPIALKKQDDVLGCPVQEFTKVEKSEKHGSMISQSKTHIIPTASKDPFTLLSNSRLLLLPPPPSLKSAVLRLPGLNRQNCRWDIQDEGGMKIFVQRH